MRKKQIEKELIKNVVHNGDFSEISNELDFSDVKIPVKESNLKYAFFGIAAFLTSIGIAVGLSIGITEITKKNQSRDSISQTSIDPFNPAVSTKVPSISYGEFTYFYDKSQTRQQVCREKSTHPHKDLRPKQKNRIEELLQQDSPQEHLFCLYVLKEN